jgi:hypothetical protein
LRSGAHYTHSGSKCNVLKSKRVMPRTA